MPGRGTKAVHGDAPQGDPRDGPITEPIVRTSTFRFATTASLIEASQGSTGFYTRYGHPNFDVVEAKYAALHGAEGAVLFASGMGALAGVFQAFLRAGDRVVLQRDIYGGTRALLAELEERWGVDVTWVATGDLDALAAALPGARLFMAESPTNPLLKVIDLAATSARCREAGVLFVLDATFDGPLGCTPLAFGVDLVVESATKSLGGHSDLLGGLVAGAAGPCDELRRARRLYGAVPDPETAWLLDRGMRTLPARVGRQNATALDLARRLDVDPRAEAVMHPALESHPQRALVERQAAACDGHGGGSLIAFRCAAGPEAAIRFCDHLRLIAHAPSLGGVESLVSLPVFTSHAPFSAEERAHAGITDDLVRLSIGQEDADDLWADIDAALR